MRRFRRPGLFGRRPTGTDAGAPLGDGAASVHATSERRRFELDREIADLRRILGSLGEGVLAVDQSGIVVYANRVAYRLLDLAPGRCLGHHMFAVVPHDKVCDALEIVMRGDSTAPSQHEVLLERPDGEATISISIAVSPLRVVADHDGIDTVDDRSEGAIAVVRDVSDLRRLERSRHEFFANVSHELKTPITAIRGSLETIVDADGMQRRDVDRFVHGALVHARRLGALVADLLTLSRFEGGPRELQIAPVSLRTLVLEVFGTQAQAAATQDVRLELVEGDLEPVYGDEEALRQAISNLVSNAIAHSPVGEVVTVRLVMDSAAQVVHLSVEDQGDGIPEAAIDRIFERFYRVDAARSRERGGTGIGLSIVKHVMHAHHGSASVESAPGHGSRFLLRIPVSRDRAAGT